MTTRVILPYKNTSPVLAEGVFVADTARVTGNTHIGRNSSIWFGAVLRGDVHRIQIGEMTNFQDNAVGHVTTNKWPLIIGNRVTIGHGAIVHGCTIQDESLVGMGAVVLDGAIVQTGSMVAAGSVVPPGKVVETGWVWMNGKLARPLTTDERAYLTWSAVHYVEVSRAYLAPQG